MLAEKVQLTISKWQIKPEKILMVVTDNGAYIVKAVRSVQWKESVAQSSVQAENFAVDDESESDYDSVAENEEAENSIDSVMDTDEQRDTESEELHAELEMHERIGLPQFPCVTHTLQLVLKELDINAGYKHLIAKARSLVREIRVSSVATEKLLAKCVKTVIVDCSTRWNSVYLMTNRLVEIKQSVNEVMEEMGKDTLLFNEWTKLSEFNSVLEPFKRHTDMMQTDTMALSNVIPCLLELTIHLKQSTLPKSLTTSLLQSLRSRFATCLDPFCEGFHPLAAAACYLDPTVSAVMFRDDTRQMMEAAKAYIKQMEFIILKCKWHILLLLL
jgi:hypothetical protein